MGLREVQKEAARMGFNPGPPDGIWGRRTETALMKALAQLEGKIVSLRDPLAYDFVPLDWMPMARMTRVINHWSAGSYRAWSGSKKAYHLCIEGPEAKLVRGTNPITANETIKGAYAAHTRGINTGSIGVSVMSMHGAKERPFDAGKYPLTVSQWDMLVMVNADLCERYGLEVTKQTVLTHAEVASTLGVWQRAKWDIAQLPFMSWLNTAEKVGNKLRFDVQAELNKREGN